MRWDAHEKQGLCFLKATLLTELIWELLSTNLYSAGQDLSCNSYHLVQNKCWLLNPLLMLPTAGPQLGPLSSCTKAAELESGCSTVVPGMRNTDPQLQPPHLSYNTSLDRVPLLKIFFPFEIQIITACLLTYPTRTVSCYGEGSNRTLITVKFSVQK